MKLSTFLPESRPSVLLIDDSEEELRALSQQLGQTRFRLSLADNGRTGYQKAVVSRPDIILLDVMMPELDGFATCRILKADPATQPIPIIFLTAQNAPQERLRGLQLGGVDYVAKPVLAEEVVARIFIHLQRSGDTSRPGSVAASGNVTGIAPEQALFNAAAALIQESIGKTLPVPQLAQRLGTHEKRLGQIFRDLSGMTVSAFITEQRMALARQLLAHTDMPIQGIALETGFKNAAYFSTAFSTRMGMPPSVYREYLKNKGDTAAGQPSDDGVA